MKNFFALGLILSLAISLSINAGVMSAGVYKQEYKALKEGSYKFIFDKYVNGSLKDIQRDIHNYGELSYGERWHRTLFLAIGGLVITSETMPKLYGYVDTMCKEQKIKTPTIFILPREGFFNAMAQKLLGETTGGIIIGQDLVLESSDEELEAIVAHEIGHIKHDHVRKNVLTAVSLGLVSYAGFYMLGKKYGLVKDQFYYSELTEQEAIRNVISFLAAVTGGILSKLVIGKRFEREADEFAYKTMGKGKGLAQFFENLQQKDKQRDIDFDDTYALLQDKKSNIDFFGSANLNLRYHWAKMWH